MLFIQSLEQLLKFLVNFTLLKYVTSQRNYGFLITKELIFGFQILDLNDHFSASLNKWTDFSDMNMKHITDTRLAKMIVHEFKSQVKNRYDLCVQNDDMADVKKQYLLNGTVGQLRNCKVKWSVLIENI